MIGNTAMAVTEYNRVTEKGGSGRLFYGFIYQWWDETPTAEFLSAVCLVNSLQVSLGRQE